jgi:hypothetical protein
MSNWVSVVVGILFIIVGLALIVLRVPLARANASAQRATWGRVGDVIARRGGAPVWIGVVGAGFVFIGAVFVVLGILDIVGILHPVS